MSEYQKIVESKVRKLFDLPHFRFEIDYRPHFLKNPITGKNLELDVCVFLKEINGKLVKEKEFPLIAFEIQGEQHFDKVRIFRNDPDENKFRDSFKTERCKKFGVPLIEVFYSQISKDMNILRIILEQQPYQTNRVQKVKIQQCFQILNFDSNKHPDIDGWLNWHESRTKPAHTFSKRKLRKKN